MTNRYAIVTIMGSMTGTRHRYDSKYKVTRIFLADYLLLKELAQKAGVSMADALHQLIEYKAQLSMRVTMARSMPVISAKSMPVTSARARSTPVTIGFSREVKSVNGHRQIE